MVLVGCDLKGGSRVRELAPSDRFRLESIKALAREISESTGEIEGQVLIPLPQSLKENPYVPEANKREYLYIRKKDGVLIYESKNFLSMARRGESVSQGVSP